MSEEITRDEIRQVLDLELGDNDSGEATVRGYLLKLLAKVWIEDEGFDGKRPFGNSSWDYDIKVPMLKAGIIRGKLDEDGYVDELNDEEADRLVLAAIAALDAPGDQLTYTPAGYQGPAQHTFTTACDGFHPVGEQCNLPADL